MDLQLLLGKFKKFLSIPGKKKLSNNKSLSPIFIIGSGRSGNTLLRRLLNNHSKIFIPPETYVLGRVIYLYQINNNLEWKKLSSLVFDTFESHPEFETFGMTSLEETKIQAIRLPESERSLDNLIHLFYLNYAKTHNISKTFWGDKTPINSFYLPSISKVFPNAFYIHIIRNPYDSVYSYVKSGIYNSYNDAVKRWLTSVKLCCKFGKGRQNYMEVHYEELVQDPINSIKNICKFIGVDYEASMFETNDNLMGDVELREHHANVLKPINTESIGKGRRNMDQGEINTIAGVLLKSNNEHVKRILNSYNKDFE